VFYGVVYSPDGTRAWASGGGQNVVHAYKVTATGLEETGQIATPFFPAGLAYGTRRRAIASTSRTTWRRGRAAPRATRPVVSSP
jgi:hypothetical protein